MITFVDKNKVRMRMRKKNMTKKIKEDVEQAILEQMRAANCNT